MKQIIMCSLAASLMGCQLQAMKPKQTKVCPRGVLVSTVYKDKNNKWIFKSAKNDLDPTYLYRYDNSIDNSLNQNFPTLTLIDWKTENPVNMIFILDSSKEKTIRDHVIDLIKSTNEDKLNLN